jgi:hypothetical protein
MLILNDEDVQKLLKVEKEFITNDPLLVGERKFERKLKSIS